MEERKLTKKQKTILLIGAGIFFLTVLITTALVVNANQKKNSPLTPFQPVPTPEPISLVTEQNEAIVEIENSLNAQSIEATVLVQKLIEQNKLSVDQNDWKVYLQEPSLTTKEAIIERKEELKTILTELKNQNPEPNPPTPDPVYEPERDPIIPPFTDVRPSDTWGGVLWDIKKFWQANPQTLKEVKEFAEKIPDPIEEEKIKLEGVEINKLQELVHGGTVSVLEKSNQKNIRDYKDWVQLSAAGDGNCFLNSYSVFLKGINGDTSCALPFRVKMCLEIMTNVDTYFLNYRNEKEILEAMKIKLIDDSNSGGRFALNGKWLSNQDIEIIAFILKRPLAVISYITDEKLRKQQGIDFYFNQYPENNLTTRLSDFNKIKQYKERWIIYNSGGHFQPLIPPA